MVAQSGDVDFDTRPTRTARCRSALGSSLTTMLSMSFGFDRTVVIGLVLYIVATLAHLRRPAVQPAPATA